MSNRERTKHVSGWELILGYMGYVIMLIGIMICIPLITLIFYPEEMENAEFFFIPGSLSVLFGYLFSLRIRKKERTKLQKNQDVIIVFLTWIATMLLTALPFLLSGNYNFTQSMFESVSGITTTGLTIVDVEHAPKIFLIYRSTLLFFGGVGLILIMTSFLSNVYGMKIYNAEGHPDKLMPNLIQSARVIFMIYAGYIVAGVILYIFFGMEPFDAINHAIAAVSTGGFSTKAESIGYYNSFSIELVSILLMLLGSINFLIHLRILKGKWRDALHHCETKFSFFLLIIFTVVFGTILLNGVFSTLPEAFRVALFQVVSAMTTTGFQTVATFKIFPASLLFFTAILMTIGGQSGSTSGAIKQYRIIVILKEIYWHIRNQLSSSHEIRVNHVERFGTEEIIDQKVKQEVNIFVIIYVIILLLGTSIFTLFGFSLQDSLFEFSSALANAGISIGINHFGAHPGILWTSIIGMILGRLEIYIVFLTIIRAFIGLKNKITNSH
ncbi:MAG: TrkH family potassium uptake protein [Clostridia bacterium]|nr:TrkH family potassium uptake protein [Clostridia bacterium]